MKIADRAWVAWVMTGSAVVMVGLVGCVCRPPAGTAGVGLRKGPYLIYGNDPARMQVLWQTEATPHRGARVEWGPTAAGGNRSGRLTESGSGEDEHQFAYTIDGLTPGQPYWYRVVVDGRTYPGAFVAAPPPDADRVTIYGLGDTRTHPEALDRVSAAVRRDQAAEPGRRQTVALHVGDWVASGKTETNWQDEFFNRAYTNTSDLLAHTATMGCRGNHDITAGATLMPKYWPYNGTNGHYSFDYGPVHVSVIDQYAPYTDGSVQYTWLTNDLAGTTRPFRIALFHSPPYSAGGHANDATAQATLCPLFVRYGVQMALVGHNHYYAHCFTNGVHYVTTGGGGAPLHAPEPNAPALVRAESTGQYVRLDVSNRVMTVTAIRTNDTVIESFTVEP